jgi:hypothetical protein
VMGFATFEEPCADNGVIIPEWVYTTDRKTATKAATRILSLDMTPSSRPRIIEATLGRREL